MNLPPAAGSNFSSNIPLEPGGTGYVESLVRLQAEAAADDFLLDLGGAAENENDRGQFADDAAVITSEMVTDAVQHACRDVTAAIGATVARPRDSEAAIAAVPDSSPHAPVMRIARPGSEGGRGLQIAESLSAHWGWHP